MHAIHTACGIETRMATLSGTQAHYCMQSIPLAVLKLLESRVTIKPVKLHAIHTACGIETTEFESTFLNIHDCMQSIPLAVFFFIFRYFFSNDGFFYGIMKLSRKYFVGRDSNVCHLYDVGGYESN